MQISVDSRELPRLFYYVVDVAPWSKWYKRCPSSTTAIWIEKLPSGGYNYRPSGTRWLWESPERQLIETTNGNTM